LTTRVQSTNRRGAEIFVPLTEDSILKRLSDDEIRALDDDETRACLNHSQVGALDRALARIADKP
jgi:hypothetical protein